MRVLLQAALSEANSLDRLPESLKQEKLEFVYRSHIGLKDYDVPLREIKDGAPTGLSHEHAAIRIIGLRKSPGPSRPQQVSHACFMSPVLCPSAQPFKQSSSWQSMRPR